MKYPILFLISLIMSCTHSQSESFFFYKIDNRLVVDSIKNDFIKNSNIKLNQINENQINASITANDGYHGYTLKFIIDNEKKIMNYSYNEFNDYDDGSKYNYTIDSLEVIFSHDPFIKKSRKPLIANCKLKINTTRNFEGNITSEISYKYETFQIIK